MRAAALEIDRLSKHFGGLPAVDAVTITVPQGDRRLLLGPNGAGKTTLFNLVTGDLKPRVGTVRLLGQDITGLAPNRCAHFGLARTYQILTLFPNSTLAENVVLAMLGLMPERWNPFARVRGRALYRKRALAALARVGLEQQADRRLGETSYGEKRRLEVALALAQSPKVLLLDEPLAGLSSEERLAVRALIESIPREITLVMIEHDMDTALEIAETITVMHYGRVVAEGDRATIVRDPRVREVYFAS
jgi:branched-chain amino acid transport system ATP-binding protein